MKCQNCGKEIQSDFVACPYCGEKIIQEETAHMPFIVGGRFKFGHEDYHHIGRGGMLEWDVANVNLQEDYAELVCAKIVDVRRINDYEISRKSYFDSDLFDFLNGSFLYKTFDTEVINALCLSNEKSEYSNEPKCYVTIPNLSLIRDNDLYKNRFDYNTYALAKASKVEYKNKYFWVLLGEEVEDFSVCTQDGIDSVLNATDFSCVRPMIRISISKFKELVDEKKVKYVSKKETVKEKRKAIDNFINKLDSENQRSYEWGLENISDDCKFEPYTVEDYKKSLCEQGWHEEEIEKYFSKDK